MQECSFKVTAKRIEDSIDWMLTVEDLSHNHEPTLSGAHPALRRLAMTEDVMNAIKNQSRVDIQPAKILSALHVDINEDLILKPQDIYNAKTELKRRQLESFTFIQA